MAELIPEATTSKKGLMGSSDKKRQIHEFLAVNGISLIKLNITPSTWQRLGSIIFHINEEGGQIFIISMYKPDSGLSVKVNKCFDKSNKTKFYVKDGYIYFTPGRGVNDNDSYYVISYGGADNISGNTIIDDTYTEVVPTT